MRLPAWAPSRPTSALGPGCRVPRCPSASTQRLAFPGRVFGLKAFVAHGNCSNALVLDPSHDWPIYVSPGILLLLCYTVASLLKLRPHRPPDQVSTGGQSPLPVCPRPPCRGRELSSSWSLQRTEAAGSEEEQEVELTQVDQWPRGQARVAATKEEGAAQVRSQAWAAAREPACPRAWLTGSHLVSAACAAPNHGLRLGHRQLHRA